MNIEKKNGGYSISEIVEGYLFSRFYLFYTKKESIKMFNKAKNLNK